MSEKPLSPPQELNDNGKQVWNKSIELYKELFPELVEKGFLKERSQLPKNFTEIIENIDTFLYSSKEINYIFSERGRSKEFLLHNKEYKLTERGLAYLWASNIIFNILNSAELIRNTFLYVLNTKKFRPTFGLGQILSELEKETVKGGELKRLLDSELRNALAHRTFVINPPAELIYYDSMDLNCFKTICLNQLYGKMYEYNIISKALIKYVAYLGEHLFI